MDDLVKGLESLERKDIDIPSHRASLRRALMAAYQAMPAQRARPHGLDVLIHWRFFKPALTLFVVLALTLSIILSIFNQQESVVKIALSNPQIEAALGTSEPGAVETTELADNGQGKKVIMLSSKSTDKIVMAAVDVTAKQVTSWLESTQSNTSQEPSPVTPVALGEYQIFFTSQASGISSLYVINSDGSGFTKLTPDNAFYANLSWSPQAGKIAMYSALEEGQLAISNPDVSEIEYLTSTGGFSGSDPPSWSPDGTKIAFVSRLGTALPQGNVTVLNDQDEIAVIDINTLKITRVTYNSNWDQDPIWSPDGTKIAFTSRVDGNWEIYTVNEDGTDLKNISQNPADDSGISWSPDGSKMVFSSNRDGFWQIYMMDADGSNQENLSRSQFDDAYPRLSPDGTKIVFSSRRDGQERADIYVMEVDGSNVRRLTENLFSDYYPNWSPDSAKITYVSYIHETEYGYLDLYVMDDDGSDNIKLASRADSTVAWAKLDAYPVPAVPQNTTIPPLTATPVTVIPFGTSISELDTPVVPPSFWPISSNQAEQIAALMVLPKVAGEVKISTGYGWSYPGWGKGEPLWIIDIENITISRQQLGWEPRYETGYIDGQKVVILPEVTLVGDGPYTELLIVVSGLNGEVREQSAWTNP